MLKIRAVDPDSPLFGQIRPGYRLIAINGREVVDNLDFQFKSSDERLELVFDDAHGHRLDYSFNELYPGSLGITFEDDKIKRCKCNCVFCFIHQQPKGMRRALYVKDEDFRLSFTHGNFITLSNITEEDLQRIVEQRLSPIYISVHTTDDRLRRCMLRNEKLTPILPHLRFLVENGITVHTQVVLCPDLNNGPALKKTIEDLTPLFPGVSSLAVVPVGLTRYREHLPKLRLHTPEEASEVVEFIEKMQRVNIKKIGSRFVWAADEFYIVAGRQLPSLSSYEEMPQFENGVGMARQFITDFNRRRNTLKKIKSGKRAVLLTGQSAGSFMKGQIEPFLRDKLGLEVVVRPVANDFWGQSVTVSGLLTGQDLVKAIKKNTRKQDTVVLPPNCLNHDDLFLDDLSLDEFARQVNRPVLVGSYDLVDTLLEVYS
ncbi:MAG TPA: DUF512 domain-containing protein [candidate division Zixibacteria bacterium]|nr:DUF512 domain-containing protein [candidate division Zixibacteria bacterium]